MCHLIPILQDLEHDSHKRFELVINTNLLDSEEIENLQETDENIDPQNSQQSFNYSAIDCVAMGLDAEMDQEAATDQGTLNVITNWNTNPTCHSGLASSYPPTYQSL